MTQLNEHLRRLATVVAPLILMVTLPASAPAAGGEYTVVQCHSLNRGHQAVFADSTAYPIHNRCADSSEGNAIQINNIRDAASGRSGQARWTVPDQTALGIVGADIAARVRRASGHGARVFAADGAGREIAAIATGATEPTGFIRRNVRFPRAASVILRLWCDRAGSCPHSTLAKAWARNVVLTIADYQDPNFARLGGSLRGGGWLRGSHALDVVAIDHGAGIERITATVNGQTLAHMPGACDGRIAGTSHSSRFVPCSSTGELRVIPSTAASPFRDGQNSLAVCARDFGGNQRCDQNTLAIDNTPPRLAFTNAQDRDDPELIRASAVDPHSGVASGGIYVRAADSSDDWRPLSTQHVSGELRARVNSGAYPAGRYELAVAASDVAGNQAQSTRRVNGEPMVLSFPLRDEVDLNAHIASGSKRQLIPYGRDSRVTGRLVDKRGEPLADQTVRVEEYFGRGALIDRRVRTVRTDQRGRWRSKLPAGPSRRVSAIYEGTRRYQGRTRQAGNLAVRSRASFHVSRRVVPAGKAIVFGGRVGRYGARIPSGGKLLELQVRESAGRWNTVREAFTTDSRGRYRLRYRFGNFYERSARYRFRVKLAREQTWPYKAPASTKARKVIVKAR